MCFWSGSRWGVDGFPICSSSATPDSCYCPHISATSGESGRLHLTVSYRPSPLLWTPKHTFQYLTACLRSLFVSLCRLGLHGTSTGLTLVAMLAVPGSSAVTASVFYTALNIALALPVSQALLRSIEDCLRCCLRCLRQGLQAS